MKEAWLPSMDGCGGRAGASLQLGCGGWGVGEPSPLLPASSCTRFPRAPVPTRPAAPSVSRQRCEHTWVQDAWSWTHKGGSLGPGQGVQSSSWDFSVVKVPRCQPLSQDWLGQGRAEEEPRTSSFHTWETIKSQVATPAFVWYFQKNPVGPGIPGHNLLWKNKIIKSQSL